MNKQFLNDFTIQQTRILKIAKAHKIDIDFRDVKYMFDLCVAYSLWPEKAYWKEVFDKVVEISQEDISDIKILNKVKQWTNRHFDRAIKQGLVRKNTTPDDKRVVVFEWTEKGHKLMNDIFAK